MTWGLFFDRRFVLSASEITGERFFANDVFARPNGIHDHRCVQCGRCADIDDINLVIIGQIAKIAIGLSNFVLLGKVKDVIAARGYRDHLGINPVNTLVSIHMQFGDKAASDKTDRYLWHRDTP